VKEEKVPYRQMIYVCTNVRPEGDKPCCSLRGSEKILEALKEEVKKRGLKGQVRALKSGCMDLCEKGPNVMIFPEGLLYSGVTLQDIPTLVEKYLT
jgi:(2Fe-2S) ferredoxin